MEKQEFNSLSTVDEKLNAIFSKINQSNEVFNNHITGLKISKSDLNSMMFKALLLMIFGYICGLAIAMAAFLFVLSL